MSEQFDFFSQPLVALPALCELPIPVPHVGFECEDCGLWPAYHPRLDNGGSKALRVEVVRIVCFEHIYEGRADEIAYIAVPRLEWQGPGCWVPVERFAEGELAAASFRWPGRYRSV